MNQLRVEVEESTATAEELKAKVKVLEQDNLQKEQEITSLQHKNGLLEAEVEKLETEIKNHKGAAEEGHQHGTQNEALQRRLQLLEEEAEEADKNLRETNDKWVIFSIIEILCGTGILHMEQACYLLSLHYLKPMALSSFGLIPNLSCWCRGKSMVLN